MKTHQGTKITMTIISALLFTIVTVIENNELSTFILIQIKYQRNNILFQMLICNQSSHLFLKYYKTRYFCIMIYLNIFC